MALALLPEELLLRIFACTCQSRSIERVPSQDLYLLPRVCKRFNEVWLLQSPANLLQASPATLGLIQNKVTLDTSAAVLRPLSSTAVLLYSSLRCCLCWSEQVLTQPSSLLKLNEYPFGRPTDTSTPPSGGLVRAQGFLRWLKPRQTAVQGTTLCAWRFYGFHRDCPCMSVPEAKLVLCRLPTQLQRLQLDLIGQEALSPADLQQLTNTLATCAGLHKLAVKARLDPAEDGLHGQLQTDWLRPLSRLESLTLVGATAFSSAEPHLQVSSLCPSLTSLRLDPCAGDVGQLQALTNLRDLSLSGQSEGNRPAWGLTLTLSTLGQLTALSLRFYDERDLCLAGLSQLRRLGLQDTPIGAVSGLEALHTLEELSLDSPSFPLNSVPPHMKGLTGLWVRHPNVPETIMMITCLSCLE